MVSIEARALSVLLFSVALSGQAAPGRCIDYFRPKAPLTIDSDLGQKIDRIGRAAAAKSVDESFLADANAIADQLAKSPGAPEVRKAFVASAGLLLHDLTNSAPFFRGKHHRRFYEFYERAHPGLRDPRATIAPEDFALLADIYAAHGPEYNGDSAPLWFVYRNKYENRTWWDRLLSGPGHYGAYFAEKVIDHYRAGGIDVARLGDILSAFRAQNSIRRHNRDITLEELAELPTSFSSGADWVLGMVLKQARPEDRAPLIARIEEQTLRNARSRDDILFAIFAFKTNLDKYGLETADFKPLIARLYEKLRSALGEKTLEEKFRETGISDANFEQIKKYAAGVMTMNDLAMRMERSEQGLRGVLFGIYADGEAGRMLELWTGLKGYRDAYSGVLMSPAMNHGGMREYSRAEKQEKTAQFITRLRLFGKRIYFFVPKNVDRTEYTKMELDFLLAKPSVRLRNVTFIF